LALHVDIELASALLELPSIKSPIGWEPEVDASVSGQVLRRLRPPVGDKVVRPANDREAPVGSDAHRDHVFRNLLTEPHASVVALRDNVDKCAFRADLNGDVGISLQEGDEPRPEHGVGGMLAGSDADGTGRAFSQFSQRRQLELNLVEPGPDLLEQALACLRRRHAAGRAGKEAHTEAFLKLADGPAQGGLRDSHARRGACEALVGGNGDESEQVIDIPAHGLLLPAHKIMQIVPPNPNDVCRLGMTLSSREQHDHPEPHP
jgi:hypothetical protein